MSEKKRGRPKKSEPIEVSEQNESERLTMVASQNNQRQNLITLNQVNNNMNALFQKMLSTGNFENLNALQSHNPFLQNQRLKMLSDIPQAMSQVELANALCSPQNNEIALRRQGWALSATQYLYYKILRMSADVPLFKYYTIPEFLDESEYSGKKFMKEDRFVDEWLETFDLVNTLKRVSLEVKREGKCVYVLRNSIRRENGEKHVNYCTWQKLPSDYVKLTGIGEHGYIASFNMLLFLNPAFNIGQYPDFIQEIWKKMLESGAITKKLINEQQFKNRKVSKYSKGFNTGDYDIDLEKLKNFNYSYNDFGGIKTGCGILEAADNSYMFWVQLPQELCYVFASDTSHAWAIPDSLALFNELQNLSDYDTLAGLLASTPLTAILTGEVQLIADSNLNAGADQTALSPDTIMGYTNKFNEAVSSNIEAYIAPFKNLKLQSLPNVPNSSDITTKAVQNFVTKSGMGGLLSASDKPSVAAIKAAQLVFEAECDFLTKQFESVLNMIINELIGTEYDWKLNIWGGVFTLDTEIKRDKELFVSGGDFVLPKLASAYNLRLRDVKAVGRYIKSLKLYDDFMTITQATQERQSSEQQENKNDTAGRPEVDENEIDNDNTAASKESGLDTIDVRSFVINSVNQSKCLLCGELTDEIFCENCKEELGVEE